MKQNIVIEYTADVEYEIKANKYNTKCTIMGLIIAFSIFICNELGIFIIDKPLVRVGVALTIVSGLLGMLIVKIVGYEKPQTKYIILFATTAGIYFMHMFISFHIIIILGIPFLMAALYASEKVNISIYIYSLVWLTIAVIGNYKVGLIDMNELGYSVSKVSDYGGEILINVPEFGPKVILDLVLFIVIPRGMCMLTYMFLINMVKKSIAEMIAAKNRVEQNSKIDEMTGLFNKNEYIRAIKEVYSNKDHIGIMYIDVNGLKLVNDTQGHEKGDELICKVAKSIAYMTEEGVEGYRIGGDEFVVLLDNASNARLMAFQAQWQKVLDDINKKDISGNIASAASGYSYGKGSDIYSLIEEADQNMYKNKQIMKNAHL